MTSSRRERKVVCVVEDQTWQAWDCGTACLTTSFQLIRCRPVSVNLFQQSYL